MTRLERAKQFMPFAALHGFEDAIKRKEFLPTKRVELTEEGAAILNEAVLSLKKGDVIKAEYYFVDRYIDITGAVTEINLALRYIKVIKTKILFDDLLSVKVVK